MLLVGATLKGYAIEASDGKIGTVSDFLFDGESWKVRWLVIDTNGWLTGRRVLLHPSAIGQADHEKRELRVSLTKEQVEKSPSVVEDQPVSQQVELHLYDYYRWDPFWGESYFAASPNGIIVPLAAPPGPIVPAHQTGGGSPPTPEEGDPHLHSATDVTGYHIQATDGEIGHIEDFLVDTVRWGIHYLIVDTKNWWPGEHVLISPYAVKKISWPDHQIQLDVTRAQVKSSPLWKPAEMVGRAYETRLNAYEKRLHKHYGWPGYGWF